MYHPKCETSTGARSVDKPDKHRDYADDGIFNQPKLTVNNQQQFVKGKAGRDDELVKYMSNLPGYLQRLEREENSQDKAFNVGVLDWSRLERWKHNQKSVPPRRDKVSSSTREKSPSTSNSLSLKTNIKTVALSGASSRKDNHSPGVKPSKVKVIKSQNIVTGSKITLDRQKTIPQTSTFSGKSSSDVILEKQKRKNKELYQRVSSVMGNSSSTFRNYVTLLRPRENASSWDGEAEESLDEMHEEKVTSHARASSSTLRSSRFLLGSKEKMSGGDGESETKKRSEELPESSTDLNHQQQPRKHKNIVLLMPRKLIQNGCPEESRKLLDVNLTDENMSSIPGSFSPEEVRSAECISGIPQLCHLPSRLENKTKPDSIMDRSINFKSDKLSCDASQVSRCLNENSQMLSDKDAGQTNIMPGKPNISETLKVLDQETGELAAKKGRNRSPNRRFSFSLGRMSRSFSFKEDISVPQLSSASVSDNSYLVRPASPRFDNSREKASDHKSARSSPFRRILEPFLKSKASLSQFHPAEIVQPLKGNLNSSSFTLNNATETGSKQKNETSVAQALFHFTSKNGLPLFRFEISNGSSILAASMKNLPVSGKHDSSQNYTFYSVNEIKKKSSGRISQGSKCKSGGYMYNVVGHMKISIPCALPLTGQNTDKHDVVKEAVLFGVEMGQLQVSPKFMPTRELAAIVVKIHSENSSLVAQWRDRKGDTEEKDVIGCFYSNSNKDFVSTTVILPDDVHGFPNKGAPSPLIDRWKSGGLCDCGGWDVGCKLRILINQNKGVQRSSEACLISDHVELYVEGGAHKNRPIFSLAPLKEGCYSIEYHSSISPLQAFFICVTHVGCEKASDLSDAGNLCEPKAILEPRQSGDVVSKKPHIAVQIEAPVKYAPNPPLSPVGRV